MPRLKKLLRWAAWAAAVLALGIMVLYLLASWKPSHYKPAGQTQIQKERAAQEFLRVIGRFTSEGQKDAPFELELEQAQINRFLDALDEIAFMRLNTRKKTHNRGDVHHMMDQAGLAEPCVRFADGCMTLMIRTNEYGKILSADIAFSFTDDGRLTVHLKATRVGLLPVPRFAVRHRLEQFKRTLDERVEQLAAARAEVDSEASAYGFGGLATIDMTELFATIISAIDEEPLPARLKFINARIEHIEISDGLLVLTVVPEEEEEEEEEEN